jgi:plastocyanin
MREHHPKTLWALILILALVVTVSLTGCGGGDSGESSAPATSEKPAETPKPAPAKVEGTPGPTGSASISGSVRYEGEVPPVRPIKMNADPGCAKKHSTAPMSEMLVLDENRGMSNVLVRVTGGLPGGSYPAPTEAAVLDQDGCRYVPHMLGVMKGQPVKVLNSDGLLHNVHAMPKVNKEFNTAMPGSRTEAEVVFNESEDAFKIKCDVHPWMGAFVAVSDHPFFDVTATDGSFEISNLPAGSYEVEVWHEKLGSKTMSAEVADGAVAALDFTMTR